MIYSSLVRKLYLKCCQQQDPAELLLFCQITLIQKKYWMLDLCLVFPVLLPKRTIGKYPYQVWFMAAISWIFCFQLSWSWSLMERRQLSCRSQRNYACIGVFDLCGRLILEGLCCIYQPHEKFVTHFCSLKLQLQTGWLQSLVLPPQPLPLCDIMDRMAVRTCPQLATAPVSCSLLPAGPEPCPACEHLSALAVC